MLTMCENIISFHASSFARAVRIYNSFHLRYSIAAFALFFIVYIIIQFVCANNVRKYYLLICK
jgi:hypothetical protein